MENLARGGGSIRVAMPRLRAGFVTENSGLSSNPQFAATNAFEGTKTVRIYNLLAFGPDFARIPLHPVVLRLVEAVLDPGLLVSSLSSIAIDPGETAQPIHADDQVIPSLSPTHRRCATPCGR